MMHKFGVATGVILIACAGTVQAGFSIHSGAVTSTEQGLMGARGYETEQGHGAFRTSPAELSARQRRLDGAELLVDLAYQPVTQRGSGSADAVMGFADEVPFADGMMMILPQGWQVYRDSELPVKKVPKSISFLGGTPWVEVLAQMGDRYAIQFHVDWYDRVVMMKPGRGGLLAEVERVRIIEEPEPEAAPVLKSTSDPTPTVAKDEETDVVVTAVDDGKSLVTANASSEEPDVRKLGPGLTVTVTPKSSTDAAEPVKPVKPVKPVTPAEPEVTVHTMLVLQGTLYENVIRLSELNGWNSPEWKIDGDYRIQADYTINADNFQEAMAKLLLLHPVEADVNLSQRKIYVLKELR